MSTIIKVRCTDQVLTFENTPVIASGGLLEDYVEFAFCSKWTGLVKTAVFWRSTDEVYHVLLDEADCCEIPREVLATEGVVFFGVFGVNGEGKQRTSEVLRYIIEKGAITEGTEPSDPTPDVYTQLIQQYAEMRNGKADKVAGATAGHFAALDASGNLVDSEKNKDSFVHVDTGDAEPPAEDGPVLWVEPEDSETSLEGVTEKNGVIFYRNAAGQLYGIMPITKADLVEGLDVFVAEQISGQSETLLTHLKDFANPHKVTAEQAGAAPTDHEHDAGDITSGALSIERGGTGADTAADALAALGAQAANSNLVQFVNNALQTVGGGEVNLGGIKFAFGSYVGTGIAYAEIDIPFSPKLIIVSGSYIKEYNERNSKEETALAIGTPDGGASFTSEYYSGNSAAGANLDFAPINVTIDGTKLRLEVWRSPVLHIFQNETPSTVTKSSRGYAQSMNESGVTYTFLCIGEGE